jgi:hypothetical protein
MYLSQEYIVINYALTVLLFAVPIFIIYRKRRHINITLKLCINILNQALIFQGIFTLLALLTMYIFGSVLFDKTGHIAAVDIAIETSYVYTVTAIFIYLPIILFINLILFSIRGIKKLKR